MFKKKIGLKSSYLPLKLAMRVGSLSF